MNSRAPGAIAPELTTLAIAVALAVALMALCAALPSPARETFPPRANPCCESCSRSYSAPADATAFAILFDNASPLGIGEEQAPFAQRYAADFGRSGNMDSPRGGPPSRRSHHSRSMYAVGAFRAASNIA